MIIRSGPSSLQTREQIREHELHMRRIAQVRGTVNNRKPKKVGHLHSKPKQKPSGKREQLQLEKFEEIQRENRILLKKMLTIDMKGSELNPRAFKPIQGPGAYSLNRGKRIEQLTKVTSENRVPSSLTPSACSSGFRRPTPITTATSGGKTILRTNT